MIRDMFGGSSKSKGKFDTLSNSGGSVVPEDGEVKIEKKTQKENKIPKPQLPPPTSNDDEDITETEGLTNCKCGKFRVTITDFLTDTNIADEDNDDTQKNR